MRAIAGICGTVLGAVAFSLVNFLVHLILMPYLLTDGFYVLLIYFFFAPQGAWLGGFTGYALATVHDADHRRTGFTLLIGSVLLIVAALICAFSHSSDRWDYLTSYFGASLLWAAGLIIWAIIWAKSKPSAVS